MKRRIKKGSRLIPEQKQSQGEEMPEPHLQRLRSSSLKMHPTEAFYNALLNNLTDGIAISVGRGKVLVNKALLNIYGLKHYPGVRRQSLHDFVHPEDREIVKARSSSFLQGESGTTTFEYRICRPDEAIRVLQVTPAMIAYKGQSAVIAIIRDITEMKMAQEKVRHLAELEQEAAEHKAAMRELEAFNDMVCHDLRVPLIVTEKLIHKLSREYTFILDQRFAEITGMIDRNIDWMNQLIDGLLTYKQLAGHRVKRTRVSMEHLVRSVIDVISMMYQGRNITLNIGTLPPAYGDERMLRQLFTNLISNAFKFTQYRKTAIIEVGASEGPHETIYYVKDNGEGFDMKYMDNLFNVFGRLHDPDKFRGIGIGLVIVKRIAERHRARVWAEGKVGDGASFYFALPRNTAAMTSA
ncbi:MAG: Phytochrome-like protein cph1 [Syntrophorhabdus sp. PtaB.Bin006]|nr:MAG: Phytochrome-like protein cph1 [Syntrophorhabdus sp. PtaB.Bin006]